MAFKRVMVTGSNGGIGKEVARQMALTAGVERVYLACRNRQKANEAKADLQRDTGKNVFEVVVVDLSDPVSVRKVVAGLSGPIDALVMNAGGLGGADWAGTTKAGVTELFAQNVLGHAVLVQELIAADKLTTAAVLAGSEAARGIPMMGMKQPSFDTGSTEEFASVIDGSYYKTHKVDRMSAYGQVKYLGAQWMAAMARKHPSVRFVTVSPGSTHSTSVMNHAPAVVQFIFGRLVLPFVFPLIGMAHGLSTGAKRLIDGLSDPSLKTGHFYASRKGKLTGPLVDQADIFADLGNPTLQDHVNEAVYRFTAR